MIATAEYTISKIYDGQPGQPGSPGASVSSITRYYTISTSPTQLINPSWVDPNEPEWTTTQPSTDAIDTTHYLWQKDVTTLSDGNTLPPHIWCERIISGIISQVNYDAGIIEQAVWEDYTDTQIDAYDGSTTTTLGRKVSSMEQTVNGYDITVSGQTTHVDGLTERMTSAEGRLNVTESAVTAMVTLDSQSSSFTLTNNMIEAMTNQFIIKGSDNTTTVISGGKIVANTIKTNDLATDAIKSSNYVAPTGVIGGNGTAPFSVSGSFFDLTDGKILTPYFALIPDSTDGNGTPVTGTAYLKGTIETGAGHIGGFTITETSIYNNMKSFDDEIDLSNYSVDDNFYLEVPSYYMTEDGEIIDSFELDEDNYIVGVTPIFYGVYIGTDGIALGRGKFKVDSFGNLFASNATIKGNIAATSGSFGSTNGYYEIDDDGLVGYRIGTVYYFKMIEILANQEYDEGSVEVTSLSLETSSQSYSYTDILAIDTVTGIDLKKENDKLFIILKTNSTTPISEIFDGTITSITCSYTYTQSGEELGGFGNVQDYTGLTTPSTENNDYITGTELGYDYLKTDKIIASDGIVIATDENNLTTSSRLQLNNNSIQLFAKDKTTPYFFISDLRDSDGNIVIYETFILEYTQGEEQDITLTNTPINLISVILQGVDVTGNDEVYTRNGNRFTFTPELPNPENWIVISYTYSSSNEYSAYTLGKRSSISIGSGSIALGNNVTASGINSISEGEWTIASGKNSHACGYYTRAIGNNSFSGGYGRVEANGENSIAFGRGYMNGVVRTWGNSSIAHGTTGDGGKIIAYSTDSIACGSVGTNSELSAYSSCSIALGYVGSSQDENNPNYIQTWGMGSLASGYVDNGNMGTNSYAKGGVALNVGTWASGIGQTVIGTYNIEDLDWNANYHPSNASGNSENFYSKHAFIIGNGYWDKTNKVEVRSNALTVDWNGLITANGYKIHQDIGGRDYTHATALRTWFNNNKSNIARNAFSPVFSTSYGNGSMYLGYFLNGYDTSPYGGFFVCHYTTPWYVGISNGDFIQYELTKTTTSSRKTKENIKLMKDDEAKKLYDLDVISFDYKKEYEEGKKNQFGLIAEDCNEIIPYVVYKPDDNEDSIWGIDYVKFVPYLIKNLQLHEQKIKELEKEIEFLKSSLMK